MRDEAIILKDPLLFERDDEGIIKSEEDAIKVTKLDDESCIVVNGPKISGPYGNK